MSVKPRQTLTSDQLEALTEKMAFMNCVALIECECRQKPDGNGWTNRREWPYSAWHDIRTTCLDSADCVGEALDWLHAKGFLDRAAGEPKTVRVRYPNPEWW